MRRDCVILESERGLTFLGFIVVFGLISLAIVYTLLDLQFETKRKALYGAAVEAKTNLNIEVRTLASLPIAVRRSIELNLTSGDVLTAVTANRTIIESCIANLGGNPSCAIRKTGGSPQSFYLINPEGTAIRAGASGTPGTLSPWQRVGYMVSLAGGANDLGLCDPTNPNLNLCFWQANSLIQYWPLCGGAAGTPDCFRIRVSINRVDRCRLNPLNCANVPNYLATIGDRDFSTDGSASQYLACYNITADAGWANLVVSGVACGSAVWP
jgi:hypothetical protein